MLEDIIENDIITVRTQSVSYREHEVDAKPIREHLETMCVEGCSSEELEAELRSYIIDKVTADDGETIDKSIEDIVVIGVDGKNVYSW